MKKVKISELPLFNSLRGLFTIGTDDQNRSVKVSLEFIEEETTSAVGRADAATLAAQQATSETNTATINANNATLAAQQATAQAQLATQDAIDAAERANEMSEAAEQSAIDASTAAENAYEGADAAFEAKSNADDATLAAQQATQDALAATAIVGRLYPTAMTVVAPKHLTVGNVTPVQIKVQLSPETVVKNVIFIGDHNGAEVTPQGILHPTKQGASTVYVIPTCNTALTQAVLIDVTNPTMRLAELGKVRFSANGTVRLT